MPGPDPRRPLGPASLPRAFDAHARSYDRMVASNRRYHDHLRLSARRMGLARSSGLRLLDVGCGTGASTAALLDAVPGAQVVAVDASAEMLAQARRKNWPPGVRFVHARLENLDRAGITGPFDAILAAYLVRNLPDPDAGLRVLHDLLRPGAPIAVHEYSARDSLRSRMVWDAVCWGVIIPMGRLRSGSTELYRYLWRSVREFDGVGAFTDRMARAGFTDIRTQTMTGWQTHIVHTFLGRRPVEDDPALDADAGRPADLADVETPPAGSPSVG
ncbi:class I SAM-dependent methyltransferase [Pseudonocardia hispaniensis]|uniref:Class I SAM-dependent methyltransferase n=1 Tax=Pseudonocardia hispaniensis TaxID=904933 RepID=A0ABW1J0J1_9PSEU